jgi:hypothetical protein
LNQKEVLYVVIRDDNHHYLMTNEIHWSHNIVNAKIFQNRDEALDKVDELELQNLNYRVYASPLNEER